MKALRTLESLPISGKRVFLRADLNVPISNRKIADDSRLLAFKATWQYLLERGARIVLATHIGRPAAGDMPNFFDPDLSTGMLMDWFRTQDHPVMYERDLVRAHSLSTELPAGSTVLLENLRFFNGEKTVNAPFAELLASLADYYVNDAFGLIHRGDTSVTLLANEFAPDRRAAGLLIQREVATLMPIATSPQQPFLVVLGGSKVSDKLAMLGKLIRKQQAARPTHIVVGGLAAFPLLAAKMERAMPGVEENDLTLAANLLRDAQAARITVELPSDHRLEDGTVIPTEEIGDEPPVDIGPATVATYTSSIARARTIFCNGTMGRYEDEEGWEGTRDVLRALAESEAYTVVGGGDTAAALKKMELNEKIDFVSTGGGATLAFLAANDPMKLPGLDPLTR